LTGEISDVGPTSAARFDLAARFLADAGRNLTLKGTVGPPDPEKGLGQAPLSATFGAKSLALSWLQPYFGASANFDPGVFSIDGTAEGAILGVLKLAGNVSLVPPAAPSAVPPIAGKFAMQLDWPGGSLVVAKSPLAVAKLPLTAEGRIDGLHATPRLDLRIGTPGEVPLDDVTGLPGLAGSLPADVKLSGRVRLEASIEGSSSDLTTRGSIDAAPFSVSRGGELLLAAPAIRATLASRGKEPLTGRITAPSGNLQKLPFENLAADWSWDKGVLTLVPTLRAFGGALSGRVEADLSRPKSESHVRLDVQGVQAQPLVESLTSMRNVLAGVLTAKMSVATRGLTWDDFSKTARGEGRLSLANAELKTVELMPQVASTLAAVGTVAGFEVPSSLQSTRFTTLETALRLADGRLFTPGLLLSGRDVAATADGSIGFDRSLAYEGRVTLGATVVKSLGNAGRYLADEQGRLSLPFRASGQISAPKVAIDESVVLDLGRRVLARQARDRIQGGAGKILGDVLEGGDGKKTDPLDLLQQFLKAPATPTPTPRPK
jgi:AsmA-like C-terminal region